MGQIYQHRFPWRVYGGLCKYQAEVLKRIKFYYNLFFQTMILDNERLINYIGR